MPSCLAHFLSCSGGGFSDATRSMMDMGFLFLFFLEGSPGLLLMRSPEADSHWRGPGGAEPERGVEATLGLPLPFGTKAAADALGRKSMLPAFNFDEVVLVRLEAASVGPVGGWRLSYGAPG